MKHILDKRRIETAQFLSNRRSFLPVENCIFSATWIIVPYFAIIGLLIIMAIRMYIEYSRRYRLNKNLTKYISTVNDMQKNLEQLNQVLNEVSSNEELNEDLNDKIRLSIWRINTMQHTIHKLVELEKEPRWIENRQSVRVSDPPMVQEEPLHEIKRESTLANNVQSANDQQFLEKIFVIIREHYANPHFNVDTLSYNMSMSRSSFFNKIKSISGQAPADFIRQYRMERAKELLRTKQYTIAEVAFKSGFSDVKYFRDVFKKKYNQSPSQFAKKQ